MPTKQKGETFSYTLPHIKPNEFPKIKKYKGTKISLIFAKYLNVASNSKITEIMIKGNKQGLLYFAKFLIALALHKKAVSNLHIHLPAYGKMDKKSLPVSVCKILNCNKHLSKKKLRGFAVGTHPTQYKP